MDKTWAIQKMLAGDKVKHDNYLPDDYIFFDTVNKQFVTRGFTLVNINYEPNDDGWESASSQSEMWSDISKYDMGSQETHLMYTSNGVTLGRLDGALFVNLNDDIISPTHFMKNPIKI